MKIIRQPDKLRSTLRPLKRKGKRIGFVPTMGALHEGHFSLIHRARRETDVVVVSLFVNPLQFNRPEDLRSYPRTFRTDCRLAARAGADLIFAPSASDLYPADFQTFVTVERLSRRWEGAFRPGHFRGVTTGVAKLFHLVEPDVAYFGEKDAQQARLIEQMIRDLDFNVRLKVLPTIREAGGLALSSRNRLLSPAQRSRARLLYRALQEGQRLIRWGERDAATVLRRIRLLLLQIPQVRVEYIAVVDPKTFEPVRTVRRRVRLLLAVRIGTVRLIDTCTARS